MADTEQQTEGAAETVEDRARRMGWVPKEEFRGDPSRWVEAGRFVDRAENEMPVLRGTLHRIEKQNKDLKADVDEARRTMGELSDFYRGAEERAYNRAKRELEGKFREKVGQADVDGADAIRREIEDLPKPPPKREAPKTETKPQIDPVVPAWVNAPEQAWYRDDVNMQTEAQAIHAALMTTRPDMTIAQNLGEVRRRMALTYPEKFTNERREQPAAVSDPRGGAPRKTNGRTFDDLPPEAKAAYARFAKQIPGYKKEQYLAAYQWE